MSHANSPGQEWSGCSRSNHPDTLKTESKRKGEIKSKHRGCRPGYIYLWYEQIRRADRQTFPRKHWESSLCVWGFAYLLTWPEDEVSVSLAIESIARSSAATSYHLWKLDWISIETCRQLIWTLWATSRISGASHAHIRNHILSVMPNYHINWENYSLKYINIQGQ